MNDLTVFDETFNETLNQTFSVPLFNRVSDWAGIWAIESQAGAMLMQMVKGMDLRQHVAQHKDEPPKLKSSMELQADGKGKSVAVVRVEGTLMKQSSSLGGSGTVQMRRDIRQAANNPDVSAIMLAIDSPGGTVAGTDDLAQDVKAASKKKPVYAYVSDLCASAAYWVASQCDAIFVNSETALLGSIGTFMAVYDYSKAAEKEGVEALVFKTGPLKGAGAAMGAEVTDEQRKYFQEIVDSSQVTFDAAVQKGRNLTDKQLQSIRTGGAFRATEAMDRKLIDGIQSYEATFSALVREVGQRNKAGRQAESTTTKGVIPMANETQTASDATTVTPTAKAQQVNADAETIIAGIRAEVAADMQRIAKIQKVCGEASRGNQAVANDIASQAIAGNWSVAEAELAVMKAVLPKPPAAANPHTTQFGNGGQVNINTGSGNANGSRAESDVIEVALAVSLGLSPAAVAKQLPADRREYVMNQASSQQFRGYTMHALMGECIRSAGMSFHGSHKSPDFIRAAKQADAILQASAGFSTISMSGILGNVANKGLVAAYDSVETTWQQIAAVRSHSDFKTHTNYRLDETGSFKKVGPTGELKHMSMGEGSYTNKLETYGTMIALTRQQIINDDLGAFLRLPGIMGRLCAIRIEEGVYVLILSNPSSFFHADNANYITGAGSAFSISALDVAEYTFANQVDTNEKPILAIPTRVVVPSTLKGRANSIYKNEKVNETTTTDKKSTNDNPHVGKYMPVSTPYLNNTAIKDQDGAAITGQSSTGWYLFADPAVRAAVAVAFLNGQQTPTIESADTDFQTLGMQWRAYHDFGVGMEDPTAAQFNTGTA